MTVSGVRSSWNTLATKSWRMVNARFSSVMSRTTTSVRSLVDDVPAAVPAGAYRLQVRRFPRFRCPGFTAEQRTGRGVAHERERMFCPRSSDDSPSRRACSLVEVLYLAGRPEHRPAIGHRLGRALQRAKRAEQLAGCVACRIVWCDTGDVPGRAIRPSGVPGSRQRPL